jgi:hypothetical protein
LNKPKEDESDEYNAKRSNKNGKHEKDVLGNVQGVYQRLPAI